MNEKITYKKSVWRNTDIVTLIAKYTDLKETYKDDVRFWEYVNNEMRKSGIVNFSAVQCKIKWKELYQKYISIKTQKKTKIIWPYYKLMVDSEKNTKPVIVLMNINNNQKQITDYFKKTS